ncbi:Hypothetical predicted protein, partial [Mytilus galloprovincialis]
ARFILVQGRCAKFNVSYDHWDIYCSLALDHILRTTTCSFFKRFPQLEEHRLNKLHHFGGSPSVRTERLVTNNVSQRAPLSS